MEKQSIDYGKVELPFNEALKMAFDNIRRRFNRTLVLLLGNTMGIAFMTYILAGGDITAQVEGTFGGGIHAYQLWMVSIALLVTTINIVNVMLMSVSERYREIGTMKTLGALTSQIVMLFMIEASILGLMGGLLGSAIGYAAAVLIYGSQYGFSYVARAAVTPSSFIAMGPSVVTYFVLGVVLALLLSVIATVYPAYKAATLSPAVALRYEV
ncbi:FtsX-like permease family protein [Tardisphaera miroshnichenkoae]